MWKEAKIFIARERFEDVGFEDGVRSQGMQETSRRWKRHGNGLSPGASRRNIALLTPWFLAWWDPLQISELRNYKIINLLQATKFVVTCYSSNKKLTHKLNPGCQERYPTQSWEIRGFKESFQEKMTFSWVLKDEQGLRVGVPRSGSSICKGPVVSIQVISRHFKWQNYRFC